MSSFSRRTSGRCWWRTVSNAMARRSRKAGCGWIRRERRGWVATRGPAVVAGDLMASLLIRAIHYGAGEHAGEELEMPPKKKLPAETISLLEKWIAMGAPWPETAIAHTEPGVDPRAAIQKAGRTHWAFQPLRKPEFPNVKDEAWVKTPIDRFVLAKMEAEALSPSPPASERVLTRRAWLDLTGMPPSPKEAQAHLASPNFGQLVDGSAR